MKKIIAGIVLAFAAAMYLAGSASASADSYLQYLRDNSIDMGWNSNPSNDVTTGYTLCSLMGSGLSVDQIVADHPFNFFDIRGAAVAASLHLC